MQHAEIKQQKVGFHGTYIVIQNDSIIVGKIKDM